MGDIDKILQGTTPFLVIKIKTSDALVADITDLELTISSRTGPTLTKGFSDCPIDTEENTVSYHFTEEETLSFPPEGVIYWQIRFKTIDNEIFGTEKYVIKMVKLESGEVMG